MKKNIKELLTVVFVALVCALTIAFVLLLSLDMYEAATYVFCADGVCAIICAIIHFLPTSDI